MNKDILYNAIDLADGFEAMHECIDVLTDKGSLYYSDDWDDISRVTLDALAAQLTRQVDAIDYTYDVVTFHDHSVVNKWELGNSEIVGYAESLNRTENTIIAIVESKVLEVGE